MTALETIRLAERPNPIWLQPETDEGPTAPGESGLDEPTDALARTDELALAQGSARACCRGGHPDDVTALPPGAQGQITVPAGPGLGLKLLPDLDRGVAVAHRHTTQSDL